MKKCEDSVSSIDFVNVGKRIRNHRKLLDLTQADLAFHIDVSTNYISMIETGKAKISLITLHKLSKVFNCTIDELINEYDNTITSEYQIQRFIDEADDYELRILYGMIDVLKSNRNQGV